jgi:hypothetical protein
MPQICHCPTIAYTCFGHYFVGTLLGTKFAYTTHIVTDSGHSGTCTYTFYKARLEVLTSCQVGVRSILNSTSSLFAFGTQDDPLVSSRFFERVWKIHVLTKDVSKRKRRNRLLENQKMVPPLCVLGKSTNLAVAQ